MKKYTFATGTYLTEQTWLCLLHFASLYCRLIDSKFKATFNINLPMTRLLFAFIAFTLATIQAFGQALLTKEVNAIPPPTPSWMHDESTPTERQIADYEEKIREYRKEVEEAKAIDTFNVYYYNCDSHLTMLWMI